MTGFEIAGYEEVACGQPIACCGDTGSTIVAEATGIPIQIGETFGEQVVEKNVESVTVAAEPTLAAVGPQKAETVPAAEAAPITIPPQSVAVADKPATAPAVEPTAVPELKSVEPVTALEPATPTPTTDEPAPAPAEPAAAQPEATPPQPPAEPSKPKEENIFEEVENAATKPAATDTPTDTPTVPPSDTPLEDKPVAAPQDKPQDKPTAAEPTGLDAPTPATGEPDAKPATEPAPEPAPAAEPVKEPASEPAATEPGASPAEPAAAPAGEPVEPPATDDKPAAGVDDANAARSMPREPLRRWIDATGTYATVGRFVELRDEAIEIQKANGRTILVPLDRLSSHDRGYAVEAGARLAARRASSPAASETAGL